MYFTLPPVLVDLYSYDFKNHLMTSLNTFAFERIGLAFTWVLSKVSHKSIEDTWEVEIIYFRMMRTYILN